MRRFTPGEWNSLPLGVAAGVFRSNEDGDRRVASLPVADAFVQLERLGVEFVVGLERFDDSAELVHDGFDAAGVAGEVAGEHAVAVQDLVAGCGDESSRCGPHGFLRVAGVQVELCELMRGVGDGRFDVRDDAFAECPLVAVHLFKGLASYEVHCRPQCFDRGRRETMPRVGDACVESGQVRCDEGRQTICIAARNGVWKVRRPVARVSEPAADG